MFFPALDSIVKEKAFGDAREKLGGKQLDIFVVNSYSSGFQVRGLQLRPCLDGFLTPGCKLSMVGTHPVLCRSCACLLLPTSVDAEGTAALPGHLGLTESLSPQALFVFLLLPVITSLRGIDLMQLPGYLADGAHTPRFRPVHDITVCCCAVTRKQTDVRHPDPHCHPPLELFV